MSRSCTENLFCANLPEKTRSRLCERCRHQLLKAGSMKLYESFGHEVSIILDGVIYNSSYLSMNEAVEENRLPFFSLCYPGRPLFLDFTFFGEESVLDNSYPFNEMVCLTDCCIASFEHDFFRELFKSDGDFARTLMGISLGLTGDVSQFAAMMRADSISTKLTLLMHQLIDNELYLPKQKLAKVLACNRASITRAFETVQQDHPDLYDSYMKNKSRPIKLMGR